MYPHQSSLAHFALWMIRCLCVVNVVVGQGPICVPSSAEVFDPSSEAAGVGLTTLCTDLPGPRFQATVQPSHYAMFNWLNTTNEKFHVGYVCEGSVTVARNISRDLPRGTNGSWTTELLGYVDEDDTQTLALGDVCTVFGCYEFTTTWFDETLGNLRKVTYITNFNRTSCIIDRDECSDGSADCEHDCTDIMSGTANSYQCSCRKGYTLSHDQHNCTDVDECVTGLHTCEQTCTATSDGWYNCSCRDGFTLHTDEHTCNDIDECLSEGTVLCDTEVTGRECINTLWSYHCQCVQGFQFDQHVMTCTDIDECAISGGALCQNHCINTIGAYSCSCNAQTDHFNCTALDVCTLLSVKCGAHSECVSSPENEEGYRCVCDSGYEHNDGSCSLRGIVHVYWVVPFLIILTVILLLGLACLLRKKYLKNKADIRKRFNILFRCHMKMEEVDPSYKPIEFSPMRKIAYTFSMMSTLDTYPPHHTKAASDKDSKESPVCRKLCSTTEVAANQSSKRVLSAVAEYSETVSEITDIFQMDKYQKDADYTPPNESAPACITKSSTEGVTIIEEGTCSVPHRVNRDGYIEELPKSQKEPLIESRRSYSDENQLSYMQKSSVLIPPHNDRQDAPYVEGTPTCNKDGYIEEPIIMPSLVTQIQMQVHVLPEREDVPKGFIEEPQSCRKDKQSPLLCKYQNTHTPLSITHGEEVRKGDVEQIWHFNKDGYIEELPQSLTKAHLLHISDECRGYIEEWPPSQTHSNVKAPLNTSDEGLRPNFTEDNQRSNGNSAEPPPSLIQSSPCTEKRDVLEETCVHISNDNFTEYRFTFSESPACPYYANLSGVDLCIKTEFDGEECTPPDSSDVVIRDISTSHTPHASPPKCPIQPNSDGNIPNNTPGGHGTEMDTLNSHKFSTCYTSDSGERCGFLLSCNMPDINSGSVNSESVTDINLCGTSVAGKDLEESEHHVTKSPEQSFIVPVNPSTTTNCSERCSTIATGYIAYPNPTEAGRYDTSTLTNSLKTQDN